MSLPWTAVAILVTGLTFTGAFTGVTLHVFHEATRNVDRTVHGNTMTVGLTERPGYQNHDRASKKKHSRKSNNTPIAPRPDTVVFSDTTNQVRAVPLTYSWTTNTAAYLTSPIYLVLILRLCLAVQGVDVSLI